MGGSGGGGSSQQSQTQGPPKWELPYAKQMTSQAQQLYGGGPYPQQNVAGFSPDQLAAMGGIEGMTPEQQAYLQQAQGANAGLMGGTPALNQAIGGLGSLAGGQDPNINAAIGSLSGLATGQNPAFNQAMAANLGLFNDPSMQAAQQANMATMSGQYLDPSKNQALQSYLQAGMDPIVRNYQQAIAPNILSSAVAAGGLGSSGTQNAYDAAQQNLASQLGNYAAQVVEPAYQQERGLQQQAIGQAAGLLAPEQQAIGQVGSLLGQQAGAASALPGMFQPQLGAAGELPGMYQPQQQAIGQAAGLSQAQYDPISQLMGIGTQQQQQTQNVLNSIFQNAMMPYQMNQMGANLIGALSGGGGRSFTVGSQPGGGSMK